MLTAAQAIHKTKMKAIKFVAGLSKPEKPSTFIGENASLQMCKNIPDYGVTKLLLVTDKVLISLGLHEAVLDTLNKLGMDVVIYDNVSPDPSIDQMEEGIALARSEGINGVLAIGGGSPIDTAKVIAAGVTNSISVPEMEGLFKIRKTPLPLFAIPTTAGTGSEGTMAAIVSDPQRGIKYTIADVKVAPKMAALDPLLTLGLPKSVTAATGIDTLVHGIEAFLSTLATVETYERARITIRGVFKYLKAAYDDGNNIEAREGMSYAAFMGGLSINGVGTGYVHAFAHNLGSFYHVPHGLANAVMLVPVLEMMKAEISDQLAELAILIGVGEKSETNSALADKFIDACRELIAAVDIPRQLPELLEKDHEAIYNNAQTEAMDIMGVPRYITHDEGMQILRAVQST